MNIYRIHPGLDAFCINGVYLPYLDIIADSEDAALHSVIWIMPDFNTENSGNSFNFIELIGKR